jgi:hypothetical protein
MLLQEASRLKCVSSRGLHRPRIVKHQRSRYASSMNCERTSEPICATPRILQPKPLSKWGREKKSISS